MFRGRATSGGRRIRCSVASRSRQGGQLCWSDLLVEPCGVWGPRSSTARRAWRSKPRTSGVSTQPLRWGLQLWECNRRTLATTTSIRIARACRASMAATGAERSACQQAGRAGGDHAVDATGVSGSGCRTVCFHGNCSAGHARPRSRRSEHRIDRYWLPGASLRTQSCAPSVKSRRKNELCASLRFCPVSW